MAPELRPAAEPRDWWLAAELEPGMSIWHPLWQDGDESVLDVLAVEGPDVEGMVMLHTARTEPVRISGDCGVDLVTATDADLAAFLVATEGTCWREAR